MNGKRLLAALILVGVGVWLYMRLKPSGELTESAGITPDPATWPRGDRLWDICRAIAHAEGYDRGPGTAPWDLNNPGDLSPGDEHGYGTAGPAEFHGGSYIIHFATPADGWNALRLKFFNAANGYSNVYLPDMTWAQIAAKYAGDAANWGRNVAANLGVDLETTLNDTITGV